MPLDIWRRQSSRQHTFATRTRKRLIECHIINWTGIWTPRAPKLRSASRRKIQASTSDQKRLIIVHSWKYWISYVTISAAAWRVHLSAGKVEESNLWPVTEFCIEFIVTMAASVVHPSHYGKRDEYSAMIERSDHAYLTTMFFFSAANSLVETYQTVKSSTWHFSPPTQSPREFLNGCSSVYLPKFIRTARWKSIW